MTGLWVGLGTVFAATLFGLFWRRRQGRVRTRVEPVDIDRVSGGPGNGGPGNGGPGNGGQGNGESVAGLPEPVRCRLDRTAAVTLLLLTAPVCARCPQARALLRELAATTGGVQHAELDLAAYPEVVTALKVRSTPTTLVISRSGRELFRVTGVPRRAELLSALQSHL